MVDLFFFLYLLMIAGLVGLFLMMPRGRRVGLGRIGGLVGIAAVVGFVLKVLLASNWGGEALWFGLLSGVAVTSAALMITQRKAIYSALYFVMTILAVAGLILLQRAEFLAIAMVLVYAGAILVTYVFVLTLCRQEEMAEYETTARSPFLAVLIGFVLMGGLLQMLLVGHVETNGAIEALAGTGTVIEVGKELFGKHVVALEVAGLLLLVAAVGGIVIVKQGKIFRQD